MAKLGAQLRSNSLWQIKPGDGQMMAVRDTVLEEALTPATPGEALMWLARFTQHFPKLETEREAVVIGDLAELFAERGYGIGSIMMALDELRDAATSAKPFLPPSGEIIRAVDSKQKIFQALYRPARLRSVQMRIGSEA